MHAAVMFLQLTWLASDAVCVLCCRWHRAAWHAAGHVSMCCSGSRGLQLYVLSCHKRTVCEHQRDSCVLLCGWPCGFGSDEPVTSPR